MQSNHSVTPSNISQNVSGDIALLSSLGESLGQMAEDTSKKCEHLS